MRITRVYNKDYSRIISSFSTNPVLKNNQVFLYSLQGYFQLKAFPGSWILRVREGRSADIYDIDRYKKRLEMVHASSRQKARE